MGEKYKKGQLVVAVSILIGFLVLRPVQSARIYDELESAKFMQFFSLLDFFGSCIICFQQNQKKESKPWFLSLTRCIAMQFGGTTLVGLVLGQPASWLLSYNALRSMLLAWWLSFAFFRYEWYNFVSFFLPFFRLGAAISSSHAVTSWGAEKAIAASHLPARSAVYITLLSGALAASGGSLILSLLEPDTFSTAKKAFRRAATASFLYYLLRDPHDILFLHEQKKSMPLLPFENTHQDNAALYISFAKLAIACFFVFSLLANEFNQPHLDPPALIERLLRTILFIPSTTIPINYLQEQPPLDHTIKEPRKHPSGSISSSFTRKKIT